MQRHGIQQWSGQMPKVNLRRVFVAAPKLDHVGRLRNQTGDVNFGRSDSKFFQNVSVCPASHRDGSAH